MTDINIFIEKLGLCKVCAGAGDLWNGDPEQDAPICTHCGGSGKEPLDPSAEKLGIDTDRKKL